MDKDKFKKYKKKKFSELTLVSRIKELLVERTSNGESPPIDSILKEYVWKEEEIEEALEELVEEGYFFVEE